MSCHKNRNQFTFLIITTLLVTIPLLFITGQAEAPELSFAWAFFYKTPDSAIHTMDYQRNTLFLSQDDVFKIYLQHDKTTFLYLFLHDAEGDLYLFYPAFFSDFESAAKPGESVYIPENLEWFSLVGKGVERFYLLASTDRLTRLEEYMESYQKVFYSSKGNKETLNELKQQVIDEIRRLRIENFALIKNAQDDVLLVAGEFRGLDKTLEFPAWQVKAEGFYARTVRIEH